ncbi:MAG: Bug family tripartite tricarboxylate transporter substrate binding protein [Candidatus Binatia bacterium]
MKRLTTTVVGGLAFVVGVLIAAPSGFPFTEDETIQILVGYSPGGGHDVEARLIARRIGKHLPGEPKNVIVKNMPGAGGMIQGAYVYNRAKRDGLTWAITGSTHLGSQALADVKPPFDLLKMQQLFSTSGSGAAIFRDFLGVQKGKDIVKVDPSKIAVSGRTLVGPSFLTDVLGLELLGIKGYKYVVGYPGTAQMALAFESGEISYVGGTGLHHVLGKGGRYYSSVKEGTAVALWQTGVLTPEGKVVRSTGTNIPTFVEVYEQIHGKPPSGPKWEAYKLMGPTIRTLNRSLALPPGVPADRVAELRVAFKKLYSDPAYVKNWEKIFGLRLDFISGDDADKILENLLRPSPGWKFLKNEFIPMLQAKK